MPTSRRRSAAPAAGDAMHAHAAEAARLLKALANEKRLQVLCALADGECSVGTLNTGVELSQSALSQHLAVLRQQNLVTTRRESQTVYYSIADPTVLALLRVLRDVYCADDG